MFTLEERFEINDQKTSQQKVRKKPRVNPDKIEKRK